MRYFSVVSYIALIVLINAGFSYLPALPVGSNEISAADFLVGWVYLARDFAQRAVGHWIILAMIFGTFISFWVADPVIANASAAAFVVGEGIDWLVFTFTGKPLEQRLLWSAGISAPIDTYVFLQVAHHFNGLDFGVMTFIKCLGVFCLWQYWRIRRRRLEKRAPAMRFI